ncbi:hypothetical protein [Ciceribacter sp. L1K22]|uniref:hypothetical protein n=1 Tax=Ciceribacter sp. L1K22 TaxID=2820275 RepID=UPI001ABEC741|nr:hypothetical protein [Ciceribacter sp. L1K22]MBO3760378.1 hypothetical protein [Ciceribacter sp. L1K22]
MTSISLHSSFPFLSRFAPRTGAASLPLSPARTETSGLCRTGRQAMIVSPVRIQHLIALVARASSSPFQDVPAGAGLFEEGSVAPHHGATGWRGSTRTAPQHCGNRSATLFDVGGLIDWLRQRYPRSTTVNVEAETGIPAASVENWLHRRSQPSVEHFIRLVAAFGPEVLQACLVATPDWVEQAAAAEQAKAIDEEIARLTQRRAQIAIGAVP